MAKGLQKGIGQLGIAVTIREGGAAGCRARGGDRPDQRGSRGSGARPTKGGWPPEL